jgi:hypothetical protein
LVIDGWGLLLYDDGLHHHKYSSQVTTPTYNVAKQLNNIIAEYLPAQYVIKSTDEFLQILRTTTPTGLMASLDVESLFTNVPVEDTI